jgi:hypothetical protein
MLAWANNRVAWSDAKNPRAESTRRSEGPPSPLGQAGLSNGIENLATIGLVIRSYVSERAG